MATNKVTHVRRCHVCGTVNEVEGAAVHRCSDCGKHLAPFYFFEESRLEGVRDDQPEMSLWASSEGYRPLYGFSTYWQEEEIKGGTPGGGY